MSGPLKRVGKDISAAAYWSARASSYAASTSTAYHRDRKAMIDRLLAPLPIAGKHVVDFGCGDGLFVQALANAGAVVVGFEPNDALVEAARRRLRDAGLAAEIRKGGVSALADISDRSVDILLTLNVFAYFTDEEEKALYAHAGRVIRPGGSWVITHSNELFDLFTLNRFTVEFYRAHFGTDPSALLARPDLPDRVSFRVRENPLTYGEKLKRFGFSLASMDFANYHEAPPLLMDVKDFDDLDSRRYRDLADWPVEERWRLLFQCSMFGTRAVKDIPA